MKYRNCILAFLMPVAAVAERHVEDFNGGWEFSRDQKEWRAVDVPHDWAIEGPFEPEGDPNTGKLPWKGVGYYRKSIVLHASPKGRRKHQSPSYAYNGKWYLVKRSSMRVRYADYP